MGCRIFYVIIEKHALLFYYIAMKKCRFFNDSLINFIYLCFYVLEHSFIKDFLYT